jgi:hypothetical protein
MDNSFWTDAWFENIGGEQARFRGGPRTCSFLRTFNQ